MSFKTLLSAYFCFQRFAPGSRISNSSACKKRSKALRILLAVFFSLHDYSLVWLFWFASFFHVPQHFGASLLGVFFRAGAVCSQLLNCQNY